MTYSVVARDPGTGRLAVACQSHYFNVAREVNNGRAGVGVIANQSVIEPRYARLGMSLLERGADAHEALAAGLAADPGSAVRQVAVLDAAGNLAVHTGRGCVGTAGSRAGTDYGVQGNMLASPQVLDDMAAAMERGGDLVDRVLAALTAAQAAGGDLRGQQSAGLLVVSGDRAEHADEGVLIDLRVVDAPRPVEELGRLLRAHRATRKVFDIVLGDGFLGGEFAEPAGGTDTALGTLREIAGDDWEPGIDARLWQTVLLARAGRADAARAAAADLVDRRPGMAQFLTNLVAAGMLESDPR